jgi:hypothetical protein
MRRIRLAVVLGLVAAATAQPLFPLRPHEIGGYAGPHNGMTWIDGKPAVTGGGPGMFLIKGTTGLGWNYVSTEGDAGGLSVFYVGPSAEHWFFADRMLSLSAGVCAAWGLVSRRVHRDSAVERGAFVCLEPSVTGRLRLFRSLGLNLGLGYRFASGPKDMGGIRDSHPVCRAKLSLSSQWESDLKKGVATTSIANSAQPRRSEAVKPEGARYRATTQVKGLSPETVVVPVAEAVGDAAGSILVTALAR